MERLLLSGSKIRVRPVLEEMDPHNVKSYVSAKRSFAKKDAIIPDASRRDLIHKAYQSTALIPLLPKSAKLSCFERKKPSPPRKQDENNIHMRLFDEQGCEAGYKE